jgi:hypothetical protein
MQAVGVSGHGWVHLCYDKMFCYVKMDYCAI